MNSHCDTYAACNPLDDPDETSWRSLGWFRDVIGAGDAGTRCRSPKGILDGRAARLARRFIMRSNLSLRMASSNPSAISGDELMRNPPRRRLRLGLEVVASPR